MATYSHPPKATDLVTGTIRWDKQRGPNDHYSQLHAAGCAHQARLKEVHPHDVEAAAVYVDDFYYVAPCAR